MYHPMKNMNNQEKNTYVRQHILSALLELMQTQEFASISIQALVDAAGGRAGILLPQFRKQRGRITAGVCAPDQ